MSRRLAMLAPLLMLANLSQLRPQPSGECRRCGSLLDSVDRMSGQTECRPCRLGDDVPPRWPILPAESASVVMAPRSPDEETCPTCGAAPGKPCDRRTMGGRWEYHRARVDAAGGAR